MMTRPAGSRRRDVDLASGLNELADQISREPRRLTVAELVRATLRRAILNGDLVGGTPLALADVAEALDVSVTPVREALRMLASEGFVQLDPYRGGIVKSLDRDEIEEVVRIRHLLEPPAVEEAIAGMNDDIIERAGEVLDMMLEQPGAEQWVDWNRRFHDILYEGARSRRLIQLLVGLQDPVLMYVSAAVTRSEAFRQAANRQHVEMFRAMRDRDVGRAVELTLEHVALPIQATSIVEETRTGEGGVA